MILLERIADCACIIVCVAIVSAQEPDLKDHIRIGEICEIASSMPIDAFEVKSTVNPLIFRTAPADHT